MVPREGARLEAATFAAGCFWGVEEAFRRAPGVIATEVGYTGGQAPRPTYATVCTGLTGHAEAVRVTFDSTKTSYEQLLAVFWRCHDPTQRDRQGPDVGTQYRSVIFYHTAAQMAAADRSKAEARHRFAKPIATRVLPAGLFHRAEESHQHYLQKQGAAVC